MSLHPARRWTVALINALFLLAWGEPVTLRPCAAHDGAVVVAAAAHAHHGAMAAERAPHHEHGRASHACSCLGQCCAAASIIVPTARAIRWSVVVRRHVAPAHVEPVTSIAAAPRLLPFANGPPRTA